MRSMKSVFGVIGALVPIAYCGALFFYFANVGGSVQDAVTSGLGPTMLGLGLIGLLFFIPLVWKIVRAISAPPSKRGAAAPEQEEASDFDPDAVIARYLAKRAAEGHAPPTPLPPHDGGPTPPRPGFGRKIV